MAVPVSIAVLKGCRFGGQEQSSAGFKQEQGEVVFYCVRLEQSLWSGKFLPIRHAGR